MNKRKALRVTALTAVAAAVAGVPAALVLAQSNQVTVSISTDAQYRFVTSNAIPNHETGAFPNANNPNAISAQSLNYRMPLYPRLAASPTPLGMSPFGIAINGIPFDPFAAEWWNRDPNSGWQYAALGGGIDLGVDAANAHVQPDGTYHYHGIPAPLAEPRLPDCHSPQVGWAADGFPIFAVYGYADPQDASSGVVALRSSYQLKSGTRPSGPGGTYDGTFNQDYAFVAGSGDLDACNGRFTVTPDFPSGTYAYFVTEDYPRIPRCFAGTPDSSFKRGPAQGGGQGGPGGPGGPSGPGGPGGPAGPGGSGGPGQPAPPRQ